MVKVCCIKSCPNHKTRTIRTGKDQVKLHRFPSDEPIRQIWMSKCQIDGKDTKNTRICSLHFNSNDYTQKAKRLELVKEAIPSRELTDGQAPICHRVILPKALQSNRKSCVYEINVDVDLKILMSFDEKLFQEKMAYSILGFSVVDRERDSLREELSQEKEYRILLENELEKIRNECENLRQKLRTTQSCNKRNISERNHWKKQNCTSLKKLSELRLKLKTEKVISNSSDEKLISAVSKIFSPAQLHSLKSEKGRVKWSSDDISQAIVIRAKSNNCYKFFRDVLHFPLPDRSTLSRRTSKLNFQPGLQVDILKLLKYELQCLPPLSKLASICFDEMSLDSKLQYDPSSDSIMGFCSSMMVVMLRGIADSWKQPIYFSFEKNFGSTILKQIIYAVEEVGIHVVSVTCDMAGGNRGLAKELGITEEKTYFENPYNSKKIFWFFDAPHLLKLMRNHILDDGLKLSCGKTLQKGDFEQLLRADCNDYKICFKMTSAHLNVEGRERQRVIYACQTISRTNAKAMEMLFPDKKQIADFIALMNDWFDIFNSRHPNDPVRKPFGMDLHNQLRILNQAYEEINGFRAIKKKSKLPFQIGMLINITSLKGIYEELSKEPICVMYVFTKPFNQDCLENCFSVVRSTGRYHDTPNAYEAMCRLKTVMLGWNYKVNSTFVSTSMEDNQPTTFLSTMLLSSAKPKHVPEEPEVSNNMSSDEFSAELLLDQESWSNFYTALDNTEKCEFGGKEYIYGFIAKKLRKRYPDLSLGLTKYVQREPRSWVQVKSRGGLTLPSYDWINICETLDKVFVEYHTRDGLLHINQNTGAIKGLIKKMVNMFPNVPERAIRLFVRTRTHIRIKHINEQIVFARSKKKNKRKAGQFAQSGMRLRSRATEEQEFTILSRDEEEIATAEETYNRSV